MRLGILLEGMSAVRAISGRMDAEVKGIGHDSRRLSEGELFVALRGAHKDGLAFIQQAIERGASAIVAEEPTRPSGLPAEIPYISVHDARAALAALAASYYMKPSGALTVVGITGTNGKTTTAHLIKAAIECASHSNKVGMIGTIHYVIGNTSYPAPFTTPEAPEFQSLLARMRDEGCTHVVSEVSSHALAQRRVDSTRFAAGVFTNLTSEHLDFHHTMDEYFKAKCRLFYELLDGPAVINHDDPYGRELARGIEGRLITYGMDSGADLAAIDVRAGREGVLFTMRQGERKWEVKSPLLGRPNISNILAMAATCEALGIDMKHALATAAKPPLVEGRFMRIDEGQDFLCLVDYAHTPDALERLIATARELTPSGRIITLFGCGGDRDRSKRPMMGSIATEQSDLAIITTDNPRTEDPLSIIDEIVKGAVRSNHKSIPDRAEAIRIAVDEARPGDTLLIAGKGHEEYQEVKGTRMPFSDRAHAVEAIKAKLKAGKSGKGKR